MEFKKKAFMLMAGCLVASACPALAVNTLVKGSLNDYPGKGYLLLINDETNKYDTINVQKDGHFDITVDIDKNTTRGLYFEYLGDNRSVLNLYLKPGKTLTVDVKGGMQKEEFLGEIHDVYKSVPTFAGDSKKECEYLALSPFPNFKYFKEDKTPVGFSNFKQQLAEYQKARLAKLKGTCSEFKTEKTAEINALPDNWYFVYTRFLRNSGFDAGTDADLQAYLKTIDINDDATYERGITANYVEFMTRGKSQEYAKEPQKARYFCYLRDHIQNQKVRAALADREMENIMSMGDNEDLVRTFEIYRQCSNSGERFEENLKIYNSISKLLPGVQATDFTMKDVNGKDVQFRSVIGQGKITYIDFWATWCGPCCAEIPYVEKLVEKYKDNPKIEFVSISLDNNLNKWHAKLDKDKPQWRQYVIPDNFHSAFATEYNIRAIPRFMMFDAEGKIITINAERPSAPNIEEILNGYLK